MNTKGNRFETEKLPFQGIDKAWYIIATTADVPEHDVMGVSWNQYDTPDMTEYYFHTGLFPDMRNRGTAETLWRLYQGDGRVTGSKDGIKAHLAELTETGRICPVGDRYQIHVPMITEREYTELLEVLSPVMDKTGELQTALNSRARAAVQKHLPKHLAAQADFLGPYTAHCTLETALVRSLQTPLSRDMVSWYIVR